MTEQEQHELCLWNEFHFGPSWAADEMELRERAAKVVEWAFKDLDGTGQTRPVEIATMSRMHGGWVGDLGTMPIAPQTFERKMIRLFAGLKREEAQLIAEEWLRG